MTRYPCYQGNNIKNCHADKFHQSPFSSLESPFIVNVVSGSSRNYYVITFKWAISDVVLVDDNTNLLEVSKSSPFLFIYNTDDA